MHRFLTIILAAGSSSRFNGCKLLQPINGTPMLNLVISNALASFERDVFIISGCWHQDLCLAMERGELTNTPVLFNPFWVDGMGSTISYAVSTLSAEFDAVVVLLGDQINVSRSDLCKLRDAFTNTDIACSLYKEVRGAPAIFGKKLFPLLSRLSGDQGAKSLMNDGLYRINEVSMESAVCDIDTREELQQWLSRIPPENRQ